MRRAPDLEGPAELPSLITGGGAGPSSGAGVAGGLAEGVAVPRLSSGGRATVVRGGIRAGGATWMGEVVSGTGGTKGH